MLSAAQGAHRHPDVTDDTSTLQVSLVSALSTALLAAALILGGGSRGSAGDSAVQLLALMLIAVVAVQAFTASTSVFVAPRRFWLAISLVLALPLLHLLPLPASLAIWGETRTQLAAQLADVGVAAPAHWSLNPQAAERALWFLLPALAMFAATWQLSTEHRRHLLIVLLGVALIGVLLGLAQLAGGEDSALRFYRPTNRTDAVGLFANRNHFAGYLALCLPFAIAAAVWAAQLFAHGRGPRSTRLVSLLALMGFSVLLILGIALSRSRAGVLLGLMAMLLMLPLLYGMRQQRSGRRVVAVIVLIGAVLSVQYALFGILQRLHADPLDDGRWVYANVVRDAIADTAPLGSGLGTFTQVYPQHEAALGAGPGYAIVNHAHNDYAELGLEAGWPFLVVALAFALLFAWISFHVWRRHAEISTESRSMRRLAWIACVLILVHSLVDYPMRTTALSVVFAMMLAMTLAPSERSPALIKNT
jgi:hypothetical protein